MRILMVSSELWPLAKVGGLADMVASLSSTLRRTGHDVRCALPAYGAVEHALPKDARVVSTHGASMSFGGQDTVAEARFIESEALPAPVVLIDHAVFRREGVYDDPRTRQGYPDNGLRWALFCRAVRDLLGADGWWPDVVHAHDHQAAPLLGLLRWTPLPQGMERRPAGVFTIHNVGYQGIFAASVLEDLGLGDHLSYFDAKDLRADTVNLLKTGLLHADQLTTVSPTHAEEIQTPEYGMSLDSLLRARSDSLEGILNGVDYGEWNPATDPLIPFNYSAEDLTGKERNKRALLQDLSLPYDPQAPVLGVVSRLVHQKGIDLLAGAMPGLLHQLDLRLVVLGTGEPRFEALFRSLHRRFPRKVSFYRGYSNELAHRIEAGSDLFLMPSLYEPCGLNQMYSLHYGTVPVVRATGGLADSVQPWESGAGTGTGFLFEEYSSEALTEVLHRALNTFRDQPAWHQLMLNGMGQDFSWTKQVHEYEALYRLMLKRVEGTPSGSQPEL